MHLVENGWRWFGLKAHVHGAELEADLEMHVNRDSYVGLCRLRDGSVNVCGLFRRPTNARGAVAMDSLRGEPGSQLFARLERAEFDPDSFCAIAGLSPKPERIDAEECRIGDALTMIPPITGNGMSMAFESAQLALGPLLAFSRNEATWSETKREIANALERAFARRLRWAGLLHRVMFSRFHSPSLRLLLTAQQGWRAAFAATR
jgi:2-polyprenyl-6-methoxyphenol hydroxylase-like FAD-dependent oxidoreductase